MKRFFRSLLAAVGIASAAGPASSQGVEYQPTENPYPTFRAMAFAWNRESLNLPASFQGRLLGAIMEFRADEETATVVSLATNDSSVYISSGQLFIGGFAHENVVARGRAFMSALTEHLDEMPTSSERDRPAAGFVVFYALTTEGVRRVSIPQADLDNRASPFSDAYFAGHMVVLSYRDIIGDPAA